ncbi:MAG: hypothetical protein AVO35_08430 [Candidatus Aegiribacteria sp. MLS_C]|nr:MAG: hypothetical protein AVO35_08430 [Candidatus Aegiribacteria sp. MLS_C]
MRFIAAMIAVVMVTGCGGSGESGTAEGGSAGGGSETAPEGDPLVGTWEVVEVIAGPDYGNTGTVYVFNGDGTMSSGIGHLAVEGTYVVIGDTLRVVLGGVSLDVLHSFQDGDLVYDLADGEQTFLMERR